MNLVIMAAGMGSRFGGLKQIEPVGPNGEFIIDYSIYDAIKAGFTKVIFIIKEENYDVFRETIGKRVEGKIEVSYVFQRREDVPQGFDYPKDRKKPWGTAHAIYSCRYEVKDKFAIINADDFYGRDAYEVIASFLKKPQDRNTYAVVGYKVENTLTETGAVKRGVCESKNGYLTKIIESSIIKENGIITASPVDGTTPFPLQPDDLISMNMLGFTPEVFKYLEERFNSFLEENIDNLGTCEYLIPVVLFEQIKKKLAVVELLKTSAEWLGVTYKEDKDMVISKLNALIDSGKYPRNLWENK